MTSPEPLSDRLQDAIEGGCHHVDALLIESLAKSLRNGAMPWFVDEFADAIGSSALTPHVWGVLTQTDLDDDDYAETDKDLRFVWSQVAPDRPFPTDG